MSKNVPDPTSNSRVVNRRKKKGPWKKVLIILGSIIGALLIAGGAYAYHLYGSVKQAASKMHETQTANGPAYHPVNQGKGAQPISILLMGVDQRPHDVGRSDTLIVMTLNPKTNHMDMISIPRDTRVHIPGRSGYDKINAAYAYGGTALAVKMVKSYLHIPINYYIRINMQGLSQLVDAVGGVRVYNHLSWHDKGIYKKGYFYHKGWLTMNGPETVGFVRMRHQDPRGDFGRNQRQREVIKAVLNKATNFTSISHYQNILNAISSNVRTNLTFKDMKYIAEHYRNCRKHMTNYEVNGTPKYMNGISWVIVTDQEKQKVHNMIMKQLKTNKK